MGNYPPSPNAFEPIIYALPSSRFPHQVLITDADAAMTNAARMFLPRTVHLDCLWHVMKNLRKHCKGALKDKASRFFRLIYASAFASSEDVSTPTRFEPDMDRAAGHERFNLRTLSSLFNSHSRIHAAHLLRSTFLPLLGMWESMVGDFEPRQWLQMRGLRERRAFQVSRAHVLFGRVWGFRERSVGLLARKGHLLHIPP